MWSVFGNLVSNVNVKPKAVNIDNWVFKLHYRITFWTLLIVAANVWSSESFGPKIRCTHSRAEDASKSNEKLDHVIDNWCYFMGVFTVPRHHHINATNREVKYPGVGPMNAEEPIRKLGWYQWVHYVLLIQAFFFYLPRLIWRIQESRTMYSFVKGFSFIELLDEGNRNKILKDVLRNMHHKIQYYQPWAYWLVVCEILNLANVILQWFITDWFLGGNFSNLGAVLFERSPNSFSPLDIAFPKMGKCTYYQFGPSGGVQNVDILCILSHNIVYEKIYLILWFWYIILITLTTITLIHRLLSWLLYSTRLQYNSTLYRSRATMPADPRDLCLVMESLDYSQWLFLQYLTNNLDGCVAKELMANIADGIRAQNSGGWSKINYQTGLTSSVPSKEGLFSASNVELRSFKDSADSFEL